MKKTAFVLMLAIILFSTVLFSQTLRLANANPIGWPWKQENRWGYLELAVTSPWGIYTKDNVWLNFTVTKPSNWTELGGQLSYIAYIVDGQRESLLTQDTWDKNKVIIPIQDPLDAENPPLEFNFTIKLNGLSEGHHYLDLYAEANLPGDTVTGVSETTDFIVRNETFSFPTPSQTQDNGLKISAPQQTAVLSGAIAVGCIILLAYYFKKRQRGQSP